TGDAPRWATRGSKGSSFATANYGVDAGEYAKFATAVAKRYAGNFLGLPHVIYYSIWNEPNHKQFLKPQSEAPAIYRRLVDEGVAKKKDIINMLAIRRLGKYLDLAARAGRLPAHLPIYNTEFGLQSNPPDPSVSTTPVRQAQLVNEKEEYSYRYSRLKSYSQY